MSGGCAACSATGGTVVATGSAAAAAPFLLGVSALTTDTTGTARILDVSALALQADDILIAQVAHRIGGTPVFSAPAGEGWLHISSFQSPGVGGRWFWKRWGSGDTDNSTPNFNCSVSGQWGGAISVWRGCVAAGDAFEQVGEAVSNGGGSGTMTAPLVTNPPAAGTLTLWSHYSLDDNNHSSPSTSPNVGTPAVAYGGLAYDDSASNGFAISLAYLDNVDASAVAGLMLQGSNGPDGGFSCTIVLSPA